MIEILQISFRLCTASNHRQEVDIRYTNYSIDPPTLLEDVNSYPRMDVEENTPAPAVEVSDAPKGKMSVEDALQQVLKNAMVS